MKVPSPTEFAARIAARQGFEIIHEDGKVFAVKGIGIVFHWEIVGTCKVFSRVTLGIAGGAAFRCPDIEDCADVTRSAP